MPTFDGDNLVITLDTVGGTGVAEVDVEEDIYEAAKDWYNFSANRKYPFPFASEGGAPVTGTLDQGAYIRLRNDIGWRIRPFEEDGQTNLIGNLISADETIPILIPTIGAFTAAVFGLQPIVQRANDSEIVLDTHGQVNREIWLDPSLGSNGNGYQQSPYNNLTDAIDDAEASGIFSIVVLEDFTLDRNLKNLSIRGVGVPTIDLAAGFDLKGSEFHRVKLTGTYIDTIIVQESVLLTNLYLNGYFENCSLAGDIFCVDNGGVFMKNCASEIPGLGRPTISMNPIGTTKLSVRGHGGGLTIKDCNNVLDEATVEMGQVGSLTFDASCTDGAMVARTGGKFVNLTAGATVTAEVYPQDIWQSRGLDKDNPLLITDADRNSGDVSQDISDDGTTTTVARQ